MFRTSEIILACVSLIGQAVLSKNGRQMQPINVTGDP